jgi:ABC-type transporter Mla subunit MlaD
VGYLKHITTHQHTIMATQAEIAQQLTALKDQLTKIGTEVTTKLGELETAIANAGNATQEVEDALAALKTAVQAVDDLVPDAEPPVEPPVTP